MGSACCVPVRDRTIINGPNSETSQRNVRYSPSWSFRWDNRGRVAGEETSVNWFFDRGSRNYGLDIKSGNTVQTAFASEEGSPADSFRTLAWQKSPISEGNTGTLRLPPSETVVKNAFASEEGTPLDNFRTLVWQKSPISEGNTGTLRLSPSDPSISQNSAEVKESMRSLEVSDPSPLSPSVQSLSSMSTSPSPLSSRSQLLPATSTPPMRPRRSPGHQLLRQISDSRIPGLKSPNFSISEGQSSFMLSGWSNESTRGSHGGSSDGWSIPPFSDLMATAQRERWSFDSESFGFNNREKLSRSSGRTSAFESADIQICGVCSKLLTEKSSWGSQKIIATNDLAVVAVLICGHVYHAECLENMTPEINKYDPACPVCTYGEKQAVKLSEKALKSEMDLRARNNKRLRNRVVDSDLSTDIVAFDRQKSSGFEGRVATLGSTSSMKSSLGRPFLRRHFSFGLKGNRSLSEKHSTRKKGFFWTKSSKM